MRIAVLGWGSLVWQPANRYGELCLDSDTEWQPDGPALPVEFARISSDGRLTLVILPEYESESPVLWNINCHEGLGGAVANLAQRETNAPLGAIHGVTRDGFVHGAPHPDIAETVREWLDGEPDLDAVIWTGLPPGPRWIEHGFDRFRPEHAVDYFASLTGSLADRASEYVRRTPTQIDTPVRRALQPVLG
jgi:hypothetical protein